jgi:hypothetical protein
VVKLASYIDRDGRLDDKRLLDDINAALAAEREKVSFLQKNMADPCFEKGCQLAAETERADKAAARAELAQIQLDAGRKK